MRTIFLLIFFLAAIHLNAQEPFKAMTYNLSDGWGKDLEQLQDWLKTQDVDMIAFQGVKENGEDFSKIAKKWKHKYVASAGKNLLLTSNSPIKLTSSDEYMNVTVNGMNIYVAQINQDSFSHRRTMTETILADIEKQLNNNASVLFLGNVEGYAKADSAIYAQRFRIIPVQDRANREVIKQVASYSKSKNYELLQIFTDKNLVDPVGEMRTGDKVQPTFPSKKMGDTPEYNTFRVDYILVSENLKGAVKNTAILKDDFTHKFSSHYPVVVELELN